MYREDISRKPKLKFSLLLKGNELADQNTLVD